MCIGKNTIKCCIDKYPFSEEDKLFVINACEIIWNNLGNSTTYCINPGSLCAEILRRSERTSHNVWMPKSEGKINAYEKIIVIMMAALNGGNKNQNQIQYND